MQTKLIPIFILINLLTVSSLLSQESNFAKKHEINLGYFNIFELNNIPDITIGYKLHLNKGAFRTNTSFYLTKPLDNFFIDVPHQYRIKTKLGYEFQENIDKFQLFYGADLMYFRSVSQLFQDISSYQDIQTLGKTFGFGISPLIGAKFYINKIISISTIMNFETFFQQSKNTRYNIFTHFSEELTNSIGNESAFKLDPIYLCTINFHF